MKKKRGDSNLNEVDPIREIEKIRVISDYLKQKKQRNYIMFRIGIYTGLRISDILKLKVRDVKKKNKIRNRMILREMKTGKERKIAINKALKKDLKAYCHTKPDGEYLIKSREGTNKPISRDMAYKIMKDIKERFDLESCGTHTLRKTFGYHYYKKTKDIATLRKLFNHGDSSITLRYIGITQNTLDGAILGMEY